jgi:hypothetical protein
MQPLQAFLRIRPDRDGIAKVDNLIIALALDILDGCLQGRYVGMQV